MRSSLFHLAVYCHSILTWVLHVQDIVYKGWTPFHHFRSLSKWSMRFGHYVTIATFSVLRLSHGYAHAYRSFFIGIYVGLTVHWAIPTCVWDDRSVTQSIAIALHTSWRKRTDGLIRLTTDVVITSCELWPFSQTLPAGQNHGVKIRENPQSFLHTLTIITFIV